MTYFDLIELLDNLVNKPNILDEDISKINGSIIHLEGDRYYRFIGQVNYLMSERIAIYKAKILQEIGTEYLDNDALVLTLSTLKNELDSLYKVININYILEENKDAYRKSIPKEINKMLDTFATYFDDEERQNTILGYKMEEI